MRQPLYANAPPKPKRVSASSRDHSPENNEFNLGAVAASPPNHHGGGNHFQSPQRMAYPHQVSCNLKLANSFFRLSSVF